MKNLSKIMLILMDIFCLIIAISFLTHSRQIQWLWYGFFIFLILSLIFFLFIKNKKIEEIGVFFIWMGLFSLFGDIFSYNGFYIGKELFLSTMPLALGVNILMDKFFP